MIRKGLLYLTATLAILLLVSLAIAGVPPPPANQNIGIYDTVFTGFTTTQCKECHTENIPDRHHLLVGHGEYNCMDCHTLIPGSSGEFEDFRNCSDCHLSSPHHATDDAQDYNCSECHGSIVDDFEDGHVIPTYDKSMITPNSSYKFINDSSGLKIGGCEACHEPDLSADPVIESNPNTHHNLTYFSVDNCDLCHINGGQVALDIRLCERCHGIKSVHNIQYDFINTTGDNASLGYGHIGDNWDCWGCHGWTELDIYSASSLSDPLSQILSVSSASADGPPIGPIVPMIDTFDPGEMTAGQDMTITIYGSNFINTYNGVTYTSNVVLENGLMDITIEPDSITETVIEVTISGTVESGNYGLRVVKDEMRSNKASLNILPEVPQFLIVERKVVE